MKTKCYLFGRTVCPFVLWRPRGEEFKWSISSELTLNLFSMNTLSGFKMSATRELQVLLKIFLKTRSFIGVFKSSRHHCLGHLSVIGADGGFLRIEHQ